MTTDVRDVVESVWRLESARIVAAIARLVRDVGLAEEIGQDVMVSALEQWPDNGIPDNPGAWLMLAAKHRAIDLLRRDDRLRLKVEQLGRTSQVDDGQADFEELLDADEVRDDVLRLIFVACHPVLPTESRVALTLRVVGGLTTEEIARAFLAQESTIAQRIVRAKRTIADKRIPFEVPPPAARQARLASVLEVIYLIFNEGHSATVGDDWVRPSLCEDALHLGRVLAELAPDEPEVHGLVALMEIQASRLPARTDKSGAPIPLLEQDRGRWDRELIRRGFASLLRAQDSGSPVGPYVTQAAIAACHARALSGRETDWAQITALYDNLAKLVPTPVVELNRAVAVGMAYGAERGLDIVDGLAADLPEYHLMHAVRADFLARLGRRDEAAVSFQRAAALTPNVPERAALIDRARHLNGAG